MQGNTGGCFFLNTVTLFYPFTLFNFS